MLASRLVTSCGLALALVTTTGFAFAPDAAPHSRAFWRSIIEHEYAVPADQSLPDLTRELTGLLGSPDPESRDEFAYSILAAWIYQKRTIEPAGLRPLMAALLGNLTADIGGAGTDAVLKRSFSALVLSVVAARDNAAPFLTEPELPGFSSTARSCTSGRSAMSGSTTKRRAGSIRPPIPPTC